LGIVGKVGFDVLSISVAESTFSAGWPSLAIGGDGLGDALMTISLEAGSTF
jgi:hypothetical protein